MCAISPWPQVNSIHLTSYSTYPKQHIMRVTPTAKHSRRFVSAVCRNLLLETTSSAPALIQTDSQSYKLHTKLHHFYDIVNANTTVGTNITSLTVVSCYDLSKGSPDRNVCRSVSVAVLRSSQITQKHLWDGWMDCSL